MSCCKSAESNDYVDMEKTRRDIQVGVKYSGYGVLNEFGEWTFIPSQVGSRKGRKKFVCGDNDYTVYTTNKKVLIHVSLDRDERFALVKGFLRIIDRLLTAFKDYDFRRVLPDKDKNG